MNHLICKIISLGITAPYTLELKFHTIVWPNGADFDPAILHDWDEFKDELIKRSSKWEILQNNN